MDPTELEKLLLDTESDRSERKESMAEMSKICETICSFSNDLANNQKPGYLFIGAENDGSPAPFPITENVINQLAGIRSDGNIFPFPILAVQKHALHGGEMAVVEVHPSNEPPVKYKGKTCVRVGARRAVATPEEERRLAERRLHRSLSFDRRPVPGATIRDLDIDAYQTEYLPNAVAREVLEQNQRDPEEQLAALRLLHPDMETPTAAGLLIIGRDPAYFFPGAYIQFLRLDGTEITDPIQAQEDISGTLKEQCLQIDILLKLNIKTALEIPESGADIPKPDYPMEALQQLVRNAVMHRSYEGTNAPIRITWYADRIEILNPGGLYGSVTEANLASTTDYRNPQIAEAMKILGFVQRFGMGIQLSRKTMEENGNPPPEFSILENYFQVTLRSTT